MFKLIPAGIQFDMLLCDRISPLSGNNNLFSRQNKSIQLYIYISTTWLLMGCPSFESLHDTVFAKVDELFHWMHPQSIHYEKER